MKKLFYFLFLATTLFSQNVSAPSLLQEGFVISDVKPINLRLSGNYVNLFNGRVHFTDMFKALGYKKAKLKGDLVIIEPAINFKELVDLYIGAGPSKLKTDFMLDNTKLSITSRTAAFLEGGARISLIEFYGFTLGGSGSYFYFDSPIKTYVNDGLSQDPRNMKYHFWGWNVLAGLSYKWRYLVPYLAVHFHGDHLKCKKYYPSEKNRLTLSEKYRQGLALGLTLTTGSYFFISIESHFISERSLLVSLQIRL